MQGGKGGALLFVGASSLVALLVGCERPMLYAGTGSLSVSGAATQPLLATHSLQYDWCSEPGPADDKEIHGFSVVRIGDACVMDGTGSGLSDFHADPGTVCTLMFSDGAHAIRVTDFLARYEWPSGRTYLERDYVEVQLGGDDAATRTHVLYRFSGNASAAAQPLSSCNEERKKRGLQ